MLAEVCSKILYFVGMEPDLVTRDKTSAKGKRKADAKKRNGKGKGSREATEVLVTTMKGNAEGEVLMSTEEEASIVKSFPAAEKVLVVGGESSAKGEMMFDREEEDNESGLQEATEFPMTRQKRSAKEERMGDTEWEEEYGVKGLLWTTECLLKRNAEFDWKIDAKEGMTSTRDTVQGERSHDGSLFEDSDTAAGSLPDASLVDESNILVSVCMHGPVKGRIIVFVLHVDLTKSVP